VTEAVTHRPHDSLELREAELADIVVIMPKLAWPSEKHVC
jgi:hypothetical protein